jgi:hypothetical protein
VEASIDGSSHKRVPNRQLSHENRLHLLSVLFRSLPKVAFEIVRVEVVQTSVAFSHRER